MQDAISMNRVNGRLLSIVRKIGRRGTIRAKGDAIELRDIATELSVEIRPEVTALDLIGSAVEAGSLPADWQARVVKLMSIRRYRAQVARIAATCEALELPLVPIGASGRLCEAMLADKQARDATTQQRQAQALTAREALLCPPPKTTKTKKATK
jgi:hypothetical protein